MDDDERCEMGQDPTSRQDQAYPDPCEGTGAPPLARGHQRETSPGTKLFLVPGFFCTHRGGHNQTLQRV